MTPVSSVRAGSSEVDGLVTVRKCCAKRCLDVVLAQTLGTQSYSWPKHMRDIEENSKQVPRNKNRRRLQQSVRTWERTCDGRTVHGATSVSGERARSGFRFEVCVSLGRFLREGPVPVVERAEVTPGRGRPRLPT